MPHVTRTITRPSPSLIEALSALPPATLHEAQGRRYALDWRIKPIYPGMRFCGPALTARCTPGDNLMLQVAISLAEPGDVLVIDTGGNPEQGPFGEVLATACVARGIAGLVINSGVRDAAAIQKLAFPVFSTGLSVKGTVKETLGDVNLPVVVGGVSIAPGDVIAGDDDGAVVVPAADAARIATLSREREDKEAAFMARLRSGENVLQVLGMDRVLKAKGCTWES
ncbi:4-hydroxy-4-methyl-2-oxoglutarate aldolase [Paraburkholderia sp. BL6665CI2N2]|uniref:4-carboxy-4-hydroxy-2-oxoadipate aldolase/oxaloacetate decarboxylase n=1 Tax=Paraburkholderia sp. BL6665CI2N2 TaxID=1938806 RepID=UPI001066A915|nr:4-carboxy-4-hydroxy-2-oxoadipate aldolase/oxaloacetate decarboxylase [Paraburkholderia sp. BL6665CI2N2]TDY16853.1 4-hydroxy-4-methyl-2-oxoglutarate aldolase [Paraburkholderia sp. BL6665CI2N2]